MGFDGMVGTAVAVVGGQGEGTNGGAVPHVGRLDVLGVELLVYLYPTTDPGQLPEHHRDEAVPCEADGAPGLMVAARVR